MSYHDSAVDSGPLAVGKNLSTVDSPRSTANLIGPQTFFLWLVVKKRIIIKFTNLLVVVGLVAEDSHGSVHLFDKKWADHLMG